jgi:hypothetical protein
VLIDKMKDAHPSTKKELLLLKVWHLGQRLEGSFGGFQEFVSAWHYPGKLAAVTPCCPLRRASTLPSASLHAPFEIADSVLYFDRFKITISTLVRLGRRHRDMSVVIYGEKNRKAVVHGRTNCDGPVEEGGATGRWAT